MTGFTYGYLINIFDLVYNRTVSNEIFPQKNRRNYQNLIDGLRQASKENVLFRGGLASAISYGLFFGSISPIYDFLKEYYYNFFGAAAWLRPSCLFATTLAGCYLSLPFDNIKTRMHVMSPLPDGRMPYTGVFDAFHKILCYECNWSKYSNFHAFHTGFLPYFLKMYFSLLIGVYVSDYAFRENYREGELIERGDYYRGAYVKNIAHYPYNKSETIKRVQAVEPSKEYFINERKSGSFKI